MPRTHINFSMTCFVVRLASFIGRLDIAGSWNSVGHEWPLAYHELPSSLPLVMGVSVNSVLVDESGFEPASVGYLYHYSFRYHFCLWSGIRLHLII